MVDVLAPADALAALLAPGAVPLGTIGAVTARTPDPPYEGACPLVMVRPLPVRGAVRREGARSFHVDGVLELWYLDRMASEQERTLAAIEADAAANLDLILQTILSNPTLGGSVISLVPPFEYMGDEAGPYVQIGDRVWFYLSIRVPFLGAGGVLCF